MKKGFGEFSRTEVPPCRQSLSANQRLRFVFSCLLYNEPFSDGAEALFPFCFGGSTRFLVSLKPALRGTGLFFILFIT